jgi:hypothetical protein
MPVFKNQELLEKLATSVKEAISTTEDLGAMSAAQLHRSGRNESWSAIQHLHHLNFYATFYTEAIEDSLASARPAKVSTYKSGWLGNYFTNIIGPAAEQQPLQMKMKSPANAIPPTSEVLKTEAVIEEFLVLQKRLLYLLQRARAVDLGKNRVPTSLSTWLRLKLGDTFRFVVAHQERHFQHIQRDFAGEKSGS